MRDDNTAKTRRRAGLRAPEHIAQVLAAVVTASAAVALFGWASSQWIIASLSPVYIPMAPSTALAFIALGGAILALSGWPEHRTVRRSVGMTAFVITLAAGWILAYGLLHSGPDIEAWLYPNPELFSGVPVGRMSPLTALAFVLGGLALLTLLDERPAACEAAVGLSGGVGVIGVVALLGYWYGAPLLYGGTVVPVALPTAVVFVLLGLALLAAVGKRSRLLKALAGPSVRARLLRAFVPIMVFFALIEGWSDTVLARNEISSNPVLYAALEATALGILVVGVTVLMGHRIGGALDRAEAGRQLAEAALRQSEERYRTTLTSIGDGVIATDARGRVALVNPVAEALTGWPEHEACGRSLPDVFRITNEQTGQPVEDPAAHLLREGRVVGLANHTLLTARDGTARPVADSSAPIYNTKGELLGMVLVFRDQTEERKIARALRESEERFRLLFEQSPVAYQSLDVDGNILEVNGAWLAELGYAREEVVGHRFGEFLAEAARARFPQWFAAFKANGEVHDSEWTLRRKDGAEIEAAFEGRISRSDAGDFRQTYCVFVNITERKRAEQALQESEERYRIFINATTDMVFVKDEQLRHVIANRALATFLGRSLEQVIGKTDAELMSAQGAAGCQASDMKAIRTQTAIVAEEQIGDRNYETTKFPVPLPDGKTGVGGIIRDTTERKRAAEAVRESEARLLIAKAAAGLGIYDHDVVSGTIRWDSRVRELWGVGSDEPVTYGLFVAGLHPDDREATLAALDRALDPAGAGQYYAEYRVLALSDHRERWVAATGQVVFEKGRAVRVVGTAQDITERKQAEDRLRLTVLELQRSNADLERFAYVASHDLQEPLRMVASYVQLLGMRYQGQLDADADEFIGYATDGAKRMQRLLQDLLEFSRIGTRGMPFQPTDSAAICRTAIGNLGVAITETGATVACDPLPTVTADASQLVQVFQNLISNAIKFRGTKPPHVHISARPLTGAGTDESLAARGNGHEGIQASLSTSSGPYWLFSVRDNGIGIDSEYFDRIFVMFQRLHTSEEYPGTGIGLAICKRIIERHGGRIWVESAPGEGATFLFTLPA